MKTQAHEVKMPIHIRAYLASVSDGLLRRVRSPLDRSRSDSAECVSLDLSEPRPRTSNDKDRSDKIIIPPIAMGFAIPGGTHHTIDNGPFSESASESIDQNNNAAAWIGLGVALSAFALVFGGYVAIAGMGNPAVRRAEALMPRVIGMTWLPGDLAAYPEIAASATLAVAQPASEAAPLAEASPRPTEKKQNAAAAPPARERARTTQSAARREPALRAANACTSANQRGCVRKYATKAPAVDPFHGAGNGPRRVQRDFDQPMQWNSETANTIAPHNSNIYQHH
ncbi:hypothetical protein [Paraburkholderia sp. 2C]